MAEAERHAAEDAKIKEKAESRNKADQTVYQVEHTLKELGDKVPADQKTTVESAIAGVKSALESDDVDAINRATEELQTASYKLSELLYQQAAGAQGAPGADSSNGYHADGDTAGAAPQAHDDVIDAEFKSE
jgi:molecular chaperone DnaK